MMDAQEDAAVKASRSGLHLAQLNVGRLVATPGDPKLKGFMDNLERVNAIAERSPGFVWRLIGASPETGATDLTLPGDDTMAVNLSVWESAEALEDFVWNTVHKQFYNRKAEWFTPMTEAHFVMWWIPEGHLPTLQEARDRLEYLRTHGSSAYAFGWESLPNIQAWRSQRCA
ncbi:MAG: DUF3291 domain-containing protein [Pseudomonadota bacterium]